MRLWHVGAPASPDTVDGVGAVVWQVAREQSLLGNDVTLILDEAPDSAARQFASSCGLTLVYLSVKRFSFAKTEVLELLRAKRPDVVHMHKTFIPHHLSLTRILLAENIPYIITPHGGVNHRVGVDLKKSMYTFLIEKRRFQKAAAITTVAPLEEIAIRKVAAKYRGEIRWIPNPVDADLLSKYEWHGDIEAGEMLFLGRFHVINKGIDTLVEIARLLPYTTLNLYGIPHPKTRKLLSTLRSNSPPNVHFNGKVFGEEKAKLLANSSIYIQTSRWEGFSISVAEAMYVGIPCVVCDSARPDQMVHHAEVIKRKNLGLVLSVHPEIAAEELDRALSNKEELISKAHRARDFARANFTPRKAALNYLQVYKDALVSSR